jgi:glycosyltransferase involved in cell wall biosynthesis
VSASQEPHLRELGFSAHRITVIDNGTVEPQPQRPPAATRALLGIPAGHQVVLGVGRLSSEKCFTRFIDAVGNLHARGIPLVGIIAGDGPDRAELQRQINRRGGGVVLLGLRRDTADLYAAADVLCMTSEFEALPMAILEAFAGRLPVVAPAIGGIPDVVVDGVNGVLVREQSASAYADALFSVIRHPNPAEMRDAARASYVSRFTHEVMVQRYAHELEETLAAIARAPCL